MRPTLVPASAWAAGFCAAEAPGLSVAMGISNTTAVLANLATSFFVFMPAPSDGTAFVAVMVMLKVPFLQNFPNAVVYHRRSGVMRNPTAFSRGRSTAKRRPASRLEVAVKASGTTVTEVFGAGPYVAATVVRYVVDVSRFVDRDRFAA